ncbi:hypothetical protein EPD60_01575 [Flaviaesturariibacter flavus]|uniref:Uncharacterized protein n=1 Tax=Flaviaesturariibacter flavus TaxID=2502780 RepID=A0A4R1BNE7_9BACT|nr:hypothetical protein [Flaviaesturariibacter flavus]TCJ19130.1 hypothetical protein EPD60_01575 [Flaviaesturariibacter flavus]
METSFHIPVRIESLEKRRRMTGVLHVVAGFYLLAATAAWMTQRQFQGVAGTLPFLAIALVAIVYGIRRRRLDPRAKYNSALRGLEAMGFGLLATSQSGIASYGLFAWAGLSVLLLFSEKVLFQPSVIELGPDGIGLPGSPKPPVLPWAELENMIVRADYVTLFRNDKKYVQLEVTESLAPESIADADAFAKEQIRKHSIPADHVA